MSWHFTTAELAIFIPAGTILGAGISLLASVRTTKSTLRAQQRMSEQTMEAQRRAAADERLWSKRAELYEPLISALQDRNLVLGEIGLTTIEDSEKVMSNAVKWLSGMRAFSGAHAQSAWADYFAAEHDLFRAIQASPQHGWTPTVVTEIRALMKTALDAAGLLIEILRGELQGEP